MKNLKYIIAFMAALTITASFSGCSEDKDSSNSNEVVFYDESSNEYVAPEDVESAAKENAVTAAAEISKEIEVVGCSVTAKRIIPLGIRLKDDIYDYDADMYAVEIEFTNNTQETLRACAAEDFYISVDGSNEVIGMNLNADLTATKTIENYKTFDYEVAPGETVSGYVTFEAKTGWKEVKMSYIPLVENMNYDAVLYTITPDMITE